MVHVKPEWINHAIWWQIYPLGFVGADIRPENLPENRPTVHTLLRLESWLDYAIELGVSGLLLGPIFDSETHGYDTINHYRIDPRLGDELDFTRFIEAAKSRGLRIVLDGVFHHVGRSHEAFRRVCELGAKSDDAKMFRLSWPDNWHAGEEPNYGDFEGHHDLVALEHESDVVRGYVTDVMKYWLAQGIDGWRLDAAYAVPTEFWNAVLTNVRASFPQAWFVGEVIHGDYESIVDKSRFDSITQYELWKSIWSSLRDKNFFELAWSLDRHNKFVSQFLPLTFIGNHDVSRIATVVGDQLGVLALVVLCTVGGTPCIYYGDEQGYVGEKRTCIGGDDEIRPAFPDSPTDLSELGWWLYHVHQRLIGLRRRNSWLANAQTRVIELENTRFVYETFSATERRSLTVTLEIGEQIFVSIQDSEHVEFDFRSDPSS